MEQAHTQKLNLFQRGILQKCATFFVYLVSFTIGALIIDWLDKLLFTAVQTYRPRLTLKSKSTPI